jgi:hypothetical protein
MTSSERSLFSDANRLPEKAGQFEVAMQMVLQDSPQQRRPIRERLMAALPGLSAQATESLLSICRTVVRQARTLAVHVKSRFLTRREASLALRDRFPELTLHTAERIIRESTNH